MNNKSPIEKSPQQIKKEHMRTTIPMFTQNMSRYKWVKRTLGSTDNSFFEAQKFEKFRSLDPIGLNSSGVNASNITGIDQNTSQLQLAEGEMRGSKSPGPMNGVVVGQSIAKQKLSKFLSPGPRCSNHALRFFKHHKAGTFHRMEPPAPETMFQRNISTEQVPYCIPSQYQSTKRLVPADNLGPKKKGDVSNSSIFLPKPFMGVRRPSINRGNMNTAAPEGRREWLASIRGSPKWQQVAEKNMRYPHIC